MRLFEDIIDSVSDVQDDHSASSIVSQEEEQPLYEIVGPDDTETYDKMFSHFSHSIQIYRAFFDRRDLERQASMLMYILDMSPVVTEHSIVYLYSYRKTITHLTVWLDFESEPNWFPVLDLILRISDFFRSDGGRLKIHNTLSGMGMEISMKSNGKSFREYIEHIKMDISDYLKINTDFSQCNLHQLMYSNLISSLVAAVDGECDDQPGNPRVSALLSALDEFELGRKRRPSVR